MKTFSRRAFLTVGVSAAGALVLGTYWATRGEPVTPESAVWGPDPDGFAPNVWLRIDKAGRVTIRLHHSEMGQGVMTGLAMIVADELDADWHAVQVEFAPAEAVYKNPAFNVQMTGDSTSTRTSWDPLRHAGAAARAMLVTAAAQTWDISPDACRTAAGLVTHVPTGRALTYGQLAPLAAILPVPADAPLKSPTEYVLIGRSLPRLDARDKATGAALFGIDVHPSHTLTAVVIHPPSLGAILREVESRAALELPGVRRVERLEPDVLSGSRGGIAVLADTFWQAQRGAQALTLTWDEAEGPDLTSDALWSRWAARDNEAGRTVFTLGNVDPSQPAATNTFEAVYRLPFQAHATAEPMNCTAHVKDGRCTLWAPTQNQDAAQETAARLTGLRYDAVDVHTTYLGGGFGRRLYADVVAEAVQLALLVRWPVKVVWTREQDLRNDWYRPATHNAVRVGLDADGLPVSWSHTIVGPDYMVHGLPVLFQSMLPYGVPRQARNLVDGGFGLVAPIVIAGRKAVEGAGPLPYDIANVRVGYVADDPGVPTGFWRSVAFSANVFVVESAIDEIAAAGGHDPVAFRERLLTTSPRLLHVVRLATERAGWGQASPGVAHGIAAMDFQGTQVAAVAELRDDGSMWRLNRLVFAVDCGRVIHPALVTAQIEGGAAFGLTAALKSHITVSGRAVVQSNFHDYPLLRFAEMPAVDVLLVDSDAPPGAVGESAVPVVGPAVANALYAATGRRERALPISAEAFASGGRS